MSTPDSELTDLLQFLYVCPIGLIEFDARGHIGLINPEAVNLLAPTIGARDLANVFTAFDAAWPELRAVAGEGVAVAGRLITDRRFHGVSPTGAWCLSVSIVQVSPGRFLMSLTDATTAARDEQALVDSYRRAETERELLGAVIGSTPAGMALFDGELRCLQINEAMAQIYDTTREAAVGRSIGELTGQAARHGWPDLSQILRRARQEPVTGIELSARAGPRGPASWWLTNHTPVVLPDGTTGVAVSALDITERKIAEEALAAREAELRTLFTSIDEGFCVCEMIVDGHGRPVDYRFIDVNPLFESMTGLAAPIGRTALELVPDLEPEWVEMYARVGLQGETLRFEQGSAAMGRWFDVFATPLGPRGRFAIVFKDQTERHQWEQQLQQSESRFREMADELPVLVWVSNSTGRFDWVNLTFCQYFGVGRAVLPEVSWSALCHPDDEEALSAELEAANAARRAFHGEFRVRDTNARWRWIESWGRPRLSAEGTFLGHLGTSIDTTDRRNAEAASQQAARQEVFRSTVADALHSAEDAVEVQARVAALLGEYLGAARVHYAEIDPASGFGTVHVEYSRDGSSVVGRHRLADYGSPVMDRFLEGELVVVSDVANDTRLGPAERAATAGLGIGAYVMAPLVRRGRVTAAMIVHQGGPRAWAAGDLDLIADIADRTLVAVEQARADAARRLREARAELVTNLLVALEVQPTLDAQLHMLVTALVPALATVAAVEVPDEGGQPGCAAFAHLTASRGVAPDGLDLRSDPAYRRAALAAAAGQALLQASPSHPAASPAESPSGLQSLLAVPLDLGTGIRGALLVATVGPGGRTFDEEDLAFLQGAAERAGAILTTSRLRHLDREIAIRLQRALLPDRLAWHLNVDIEARYHAATELMEVGGDWYDTVTWPNGEIGVIVGDVVGHNLDSAAAMGRLRAATSAIAGGTEPDPAALLVGLDRYACGENGVSFATAFCLVIDPRTGRMSYSSAGHPPAVLAAPGEAAQRLDQAQGLPLGTRARDRRPLASVDLPPGAVVAAFSDGLVERRTQRVNVGTRQLADALAARVASPLDDLADHLIRTLTEPAPPDDDLVLVCLRYAPPLAAFRFRLAARPDRLAELRAHLAKWLDGQAIDPVQQANVQLVVGEACTNAIEHAYHRGGPKHVDVEVCHHGQHLSVQVRDEGVWRPPPSRSPTRGRGTGIMARLARQFDRRTDLPGTLVRMILPVTRSEEQP